MSRARRYLSRRSPQVNAGFMRAGPRRGTVMGMRLHHPSFAQVTALPT
jgi:hypothetical protein